MVFLEALKQPKNSKNQAFTIHCISLPIMLKIPTTDENQKLNLNKFIITEGVDGEQFIPVDRIIAPVVSVNELGKQLLRAAAEGDVEETRALLSRGALFTADWLGTSPLHLAARHNHLEIVEMLLKAGISRDARTKVDKTSLHMAAAEGHVTVVEMLLEYGSDADCRDMLGMTPLHWAVQNGHADVVRSLMEHYTEIDAVNKFELTPLDIAAQINRPDIIDLLKVDFAEPNNAAQHLTLELIENGDESMIQNDQIGSDSNSSIPLETILMEDPDGSIDPEKLHLNKSDETNQESFAESIRLLQEHGITMLPNDDTNILTTVMETGHSVVLTDAGKQVLNAFNKESEQSSKKLLSVTPEDLLSWGVNDEKPKNILKQINGRLVPKSVKRIVMRKNKMVPVSSLNNVYKISGSSGTDMETVMTQLIEARKTIEEYKIKLFKKEQEVERYKQQLKLLLDDS